MTEPSWLAAVERIATSYLDYDEGWDSYGGLPASPDAVKDALEFCRQISAQQMPSVVLIPTGGIQLEWHTKAFDIEIYFESDGERCQWVCPTGQREEEPETELDPEAVQLALEMAA